MPFNHCDRVDKVLASLLIGENRAGGSDEREGGGGHTEKIQKGIEGLGMILNCQ